MDEIIELVKTTLPSIIVFGVVYYLLNQFFKKEKHLREQELKLIAKKDSNILELQKTLEEKTGLNVSITNKKNNSGIITFEYKDLEQLDKIIKVINNNY